MLRRIREPFGKAGLIVAVVALVAALVGGAYAANGLTGKQKKEVKKIAKGVAGKDGAQGPAGQAGPQGPKGDSGAAGANGSNGKDGEKGEKGEDGEDGEKGKDGENVNVIPLSPGDENCPDGGTKFSNGTGTGFACNGGGDGEFPETLPPGHTMVGYWEVLGESAFHFGPFEWAVTTISFPLPLENAPTETVVIDFEASEEEKDKCPGGPEDPKAAASGVLCIYPLFVNVTFNAAALQPFGATLYFNKTNKTTGSWAVKAPEAP